MMGWWKLRYKLVESSKDKGRGPRRLVLMSLPT